MKTNEKTEVVNEKCIFAIKKFWQDRGFDVDVCVSEAGFDTLMRGQKTKIVSDTRNGVPLRVNPDFPAENRPRFIPLEELRE
jgi:hypothetical protein